MGKFHVALAPSRCSSLPRQERDGPAFARSGAAATNATSASWADSDHSDMGQVGDDLGEAQDDAQGVCRPPSPPFPGPPCTSAGCCSGCAGFCRGVRWEGLQRRLLLLHQDAQNPLNKNTVRNIFGTIKNFKANYIEMSKQKVLRDAKMSKNSEHLVLFSICS